MNNIYKSRPFSVPDVV